MVGLTRWCMTHRRWVVIGWVLAAVLTTVIASAVGRHYATDFTLPGTESTKALDLLTKAFPAQAGDSDTIVWHVESGSVNDPAVKNTMAAPVSIPE